MNKQVDSSHYDFIKYVDKDHWMSLWYQLHEVLKLKPESLLECGPGPGLFNILVKQFGVKTETVDIDPDLNPDYVAFITSLPMNDNAYDCVCAFQVLEHLPYNDALKALSELVRVSDDKVVISLPDAKKKWTHSFYIPNYGIKVINLPIPRLRPPVHVFNGEHYWEINKKGYPLRKILDDFSTYAKLDKTYRNQHFPYHRFFVFSKQR